MSAVDPANQFLLQLLREAPSETLWWVDENILTLPSAIKGISAITNRYDLYQQLKQQHWPASFSDFDASHIQESSLSCVLLRLPKEKPLVHFLINQTAKLLQPGGKLCLIGDKSEGIRGFNKRAATHLGGSLEEKKISGGLWFGKITSNPAKAGEPLDDQNYTQLREVLDSLDTDDTAFQFISKPGIYGWQKIDPGSHFLIENLSEMLDQPLPLNGKVLDLGCGYGYLSLKAAGAETELTCTDNNAAALLCCEENLSANQLSGKVIASNAGDMITEKFDTILCNPPFHSGFATNSDLTERFVSAAARCLKTNGQACFVVNKHIAIEQKAGRYFAKIRVHSENKHFKLIHLSQPKAI
jgi:16S rRNA (guanine1207-N2)-methyltransferase